MKATITVRVEVEFDPNAQRRWQWRAGAIFGGRHVEAVIAASRSKALSALAEHLGITVDQIEED